VEADDEDAVDSYPEQERLPGEVAVGVDGAAKVERFKSKESRSAEFPLSSPSGLPSLALGFLVELLLRDARGFERSG
jgi:hypothetical protein